MEEIAINDQAESEITVAKVGDYFGTDKKTKNPEMQHITLKSLEKIVENQATDELLIDKQHLSMKTDESHDEAAAGWMSNFKIVGDKLVATVKWTSMGLDLIKNRIFRFISPSFLLNDAHEPERLLNAALVNYPAIYDMGAIINSAPSVPEDNTPHLEEHDDLTNETVKEDVLTMNKDELIKLIDDAIETKMAALNEKPEDKPVEESKEESKVEESKVEEPKVEEPKVEPKVEESKVEEPKVEPKVEEAKVEEKPEEKPEEVISREVLNSAPLTKPVDTEPWRNLHGKAFFDWYAKHPQGV